ncbi:thiamine pyrophosphate-binding protein [Rhizobium leguminosarum]|uniref:thiamine pyrophosphate-binding protein n=1 Tax=Rhizobium leguminosarum TaxID=384 RepID=UPI0024B38A0F|nr:thiamine pyrophosphate-binding protein [Rhizobium leguminosarum]WHO82761.1 thiamine pyrophosphate-binding protein [Rhizobium leguminosarum]
MDSLIRQTAGLSRRRGADVLLEILESEKVEYIFGNPGTTELPLMDALVDSTSIRYVLALQEASAVAMADGYAQAAHKPGFLNLHTAGGLGHGMGNLLNASISQTPLVVTAGQQDSRHAITDPLLYGDLVKLAEPAVKWAREVTSPDQLPVLMRRAFLDAVAPPPGPVFLSLPMNVLEEISDVEIGSKSLINRRSVAGGIDELARHLASVKPGQLAIIAGDEIYASKSSDKVAKIAELLAAPVYGASWPSRIPFPTVHPLWMGNLPTTATGIASELIKYDAIFALGGKSLITILYTEGQAVPPSCKVYQLSADIRDLGRTYPSDFSTVGDIGASLDVLLPLLREATSGASDEYAKSYERISTSRQEKDEAIERLACSQFDEPIISPIVAAREAARAIGGGITIVDEAIATSSHLRQFLRSSSGSQYSFLRGGALGWGMPASVGCSLGLGREPVVSFVGDGAAMYSPQALWTAAHEELPVTFVVMNNREYNVLKKFMRSQTDYSSVRSNRYLAMDLQNPAIDYVALAASMGVSARRIEKAIDVAPAIEAGIKSGKTNLIEIVISAA